MAEISTKKLKKAIRNIVRQSDGEAVGVKSLRRQLEEQFNLPIKSLDSRKEEIKRMLVESMEGDIEEAESSSGSKGAYEDDKDVEWVDEPEEAKGKDRGGQKGDFEGFLKKRGDQGRLKLWRKRYFRLYKNEGVMAYFKNDKDTEQLGEVSVTGAFLMEKRDDIAKLSFTITMKITARIWWLQAKDESERDSWFEACLPLMKEQAPMGDSGTKKKKPPLGSPLAFPPTYVQGWSEIESCPSTIQDKFDWTGLTKEVAKVELVAGSVALTLHSGLAVVEEVREIELDENKEVFLEDLPKELKYTTQTVQWSAPDSQLIQTRFYYDEKTQKDLLKKLVGTKIKASVPGNGVDAGPKPRVKKEEKKNDKKKDDKSSSPVKLPFGKKDDDSDKKDDSAAEKSTPETEHTTRTDTAGCLSFPANAEFSGVVYYSQEDDQFALVDGNSVHFLNVKDAHSFELLEANPAEITDGTKDVFSKPRLWTRFKGTSDKSLGQLTYHIEDGFDLHVNYAVTVNADETKADVNGWYSIENKTSKTYKNATLGVLPNPKPEIKAVGEAEDKDLAGKAEDAAKDEAEKAAPKIPGIGFLKKKKVVVAPKAPRIHQFPVVQNVTLPAYDWAHATFLSEQVGVQAAHLISFDSPDYQIKPQIAEDHGAVVGTKIETVLRFSNPLGEAIPAGVAQINRREKSGFGARHVSNTTFNRVEGGEELIVVLGKADGITATRKQTGYNFDADKHFIIETFEITVVNGRQQFAEIYVEESMHRWSNWEITSSWPQHQRTEHPRKIRWKLKMNHGEDITIKYTAFYSTFDLPSDYE